MADENATSHVRWTQVQRIAAVGEPLLELQPGEGGRIHVAFGGDVANGLVCLSRLLGAQRFEFSVLTALGNSSYSAWLRERLTREGILVREPPNGLIGEPGIYGIPLDPVHRTAFSYWRNQSAARAFLQSATLPDFEQLLGRPNLLFVTGVTLALCSATSFESLCRWVQTHRHQCDVVFDSNFRRALWSAETLARERIGLFETLASVIATGMEDEKGLWSCADPADISERLGKLSVELLIRNGQQGCYVGTPRQYTHVAASKATAVDTAGAGDAHLAGYVAARISGCAQSDAALFANRVAAMIVGQLGSAAAPGLEFPPFPAGCAKNHDH
jgi:2-dehydro-3-deoxygluconokinase